jgi:hypothetical protein
MAKEKTDPKQVRVGYAVSPPEKNIITMRLDSESIPTESLRGKIVVVDCEEGNLDKVHTWAEKNAQVLPPGKYLFTNLDGNVEKAIPTFGARKGSAWEKLVNRSLGAMLSSMVQDIRSANGSGSVIGTAINSWCETTTAIPHGAEVEVTVKYKGKNVKTFSATFTRPEKGKARLYVA